MWVIVEMEWHYNDLDYMDVYGPYSSEAKAKKVFDKLMLARKVEYISYEVKQIQKLKLQA